MMMMISIDNFSFLYIEEKALVLTVFFDRV